MRFGRRWRRAQEYETIELITFFLKINDTIFIKMKRKQETYVKL